jgi:diguanylate cyclase
MEKHKVAPSPENYALWYHYAFGKNTDLIREIDNVIANHLEFNDETSGYLYNKFIIANRGQKMVDDAANDAQKLLQDILKQVSEFSGETSNYHKDVNQSLETMTRSLEETDVKNVVRNLIQATTTLKQSSEQMGRKLEESKQEINSLRKNLQQVTIESQRDFLTGAYNRKTFEKFFDEYVDTARQNKAELSMLIIDIDHFKQFNDKFGHLIGDEVLKIVARTLIDSLKGRDIVARFGGEEFIVLLPETPIDVAVRVADVVRGAIAGKELKRKDTGENYGTITVSMGVARLRGDNDTLPSMTKRADDALYRSKNAGRNRVSKEA